nr:MAG: ORF1 [Torque teno virus]
MAWGWWKRRRRRWWRGIFRRRRFARRRPRWTARRPRRRRVRRRRRWRRGRPRRRQFKKRRYRRRRKKAKIIIKQWQPGMVRRCRIIGYMAALISGRGSFARNYSSHLEDRILKGPFGGGHSTMRFSLTVLYNDFLRHMNFWTRSNQDLELARYFGVTFTFYRHPTEDFIITYNRKTPLGGNILTAPSLHPGNCMLSKRKILLPSLETRPKGKKTKKLRLGPPTLFTDKWYFQKDICDLTLLNLNVVQADLRFPFCSPQTDNICVNFQVLSSVYNGYLGIHKFDDASVDNQVTNVKNFLKLAIKPSGTKLTALNVLNTFRTEGCASHPQLRKPTAQSKPSSTVQEGKYFAELDGLWGDPIYANSLNNGTNSSTQPTSVDPIIDKLVQNMKTYHQKFIDEGFPTSWYGNIANCHLTGIYSPIYLNAGRISPEIPGLYTEILYNPYTDKGKGNKVWIDALTKMDNLYTEGQSKCLISDIPLWCAVFGYQDWIKKELNHWDAPFNYRVLFICPYTYPQLYNPTVPNYGYVPFADQFGAGQMPDGSTYVPIKWRGKWYPNMIHQQNVLEDLSRSGPFAPKKDIPSTQLSMKYKFTFNWGGNPILEQIVRDPCTQPTYEIPGSGNMPPRVQVIDPRVVGPNYSFKSWDIRRHQFSKQSIKRMSEQPETAESFFQGPKRPRIDLGPQIQEENSGSTIPREPEPWNSDQEMEDSQQSEEETTLSVREQLQQQYQEQLRIRQGIKHLFEQLVKTQQGVHVHPSLL